MDGKYILSEREATVILLLNTMNEKNTKNLLWLNIMAASASYIDVTGVPSSLIEFISKPPLKSPSQPCMNPTN